MPKIKKRSGWWEHRKPDAPLKPVEPKPTYNDVEWVELAQSSGDLAMSDVPLPEGVRVQDLVFRAESAPYGGYMVYAGYLKKDTKPTPNYQKRLLLYQASLARYEKERLQYREEVKQWRLWVEQQKEDRLRSSLKAAEALLKQHGKL